MSAAARVKAALLKKYGARQDSRTTALEIALEALERHRPYGIYDECGHEHADGDPGTLVVEDVGTVCEEGRVQTICFACHTDDGEVREDSWEAEWPCPEAEAIERMADVLEGRDAK